MVFMGIPFIGIVVDFNGAMENQVVDLNFGMKEIGTILMVPFAAVHNSERFARCGG